MHFSRNPRFNLRSTRGFALVVTLIMLVLAAVIVIALLSSASLDRVTAKSNDDRYQAELAAQNALAAAKKALVASPNGSTGITADDNFLVLRTDGAQLNSNGTKDAYYFLAKARGGASDKVDCYPLFSGGSESELTINHTNNPSVEAPSAPLTAFAASPAKDAAGNPYPVLLSYQQRPFTQWQEMRDPSDTAVSPAHNLPYQRYTFWIEDLAGYLDASVVGNVKGGASTHQRGDGTNPEEIALFTVFNSGLANDSGTTPAKTLIDNRALLFTVPTLQQAASPAPAPTPAGQTDVTQPNLVVRLGIDNGGERNLIPLGFGYKDEGNPKTNLNSLISDATKTDDQKVTAIATVINDNLPQFAALRKGGLAATEDYVKTLAANMIGYATGEPVVGSGYRGIGLYPFVVEFYERFIWQKNAAETTNFYFNASTGTWWADVKATGFVQLWNMSNKEINSGALTFTDINRYYAYVGGTSEAHKFDDAIGSKTIPFSAANPLLPNEFKVFQVYDHVYHFDSGLAVRPTGAAATVYLGSENGPKIDPETCGYITKWNGKVVERAGQGVLDGARDDGTDKYVSLNYSGLQRNYVAPETPNSASDPKWRGTLPGLRYDDFAETLFNVGDPRSAYYITEVQANVAYDKQSAWWGRIYQSGLVAGGNWKAAETTVASWPDGGHSTVKGLLPGTTTKEPMGLAPAPATESGKAPARINGTGQFGSITELGRIYDPIQWKPAGFPPLDRADFEAKWKTAWKSDMVADADYGCASTLRIGSPEFKNFDTEDARAARLLDLFSVTGRSTTRGLVNLNTANRESLRALAAGIKIGSNNIDTAITPATVHGPRNTPATPVEADKFADTVIKNRPFLALSKLSGIATDLADRNTLFFGNESQWSQDGPTEWNDSAHEDYFARIFNLSTVRSRNFRVFVTGQALDKNGNVLSTVNRVYQVYLQPVRDSSGKITAQQTQVMYEKDL
jgi:type II secretory pathway pseudopilin PulG